MNRLIWYFLSIIIFSRLFYVISAWHSMKYMKSPVEFFIMNDYNFSLFGALFGYFLILLFSLRINKIKADNYIDVSILSFLFVSVIGYIGSFFGGQVYGRETNFGIEILYSQPHSTVPYEVAIFPLPLVYSIVCFIIFSILYTLSTILHIRGFIGYMGLILYSSTVLSLEYFSGKQDVVKNSLGYINMNQGIAILIIIFATYSLFRLIKNMPTKTEVINT